MVISTSPISDSDASTTGEYDRWTLRRRHRVAAVTDEQLQRITHVMRQAAFPASHLFEYNGRRTEIRPSVSKMLQALWRNQGRGLDAEAWFASTYDRVGSLRAVRQTAFRCSRVLERVDCPLVIHCRALTVYPQFRRRIFDHGGPVSLAR